MINETEAAASVAAEHRMWVWDQSYRARHSLNALNRAQPHLRLALDWLSRADEDPEMMALAQRMRQIYSLAKELRTSLRAIERWAERESAT